MNQQADGHDEDDDSDQLPLSLTFTELDAVLAKHSGKNIKENNPRLYESITLLLEWGVPKKTIAKRLKVSKNAVIAIARCEEPTTVEHHKKVMLSGLRALSRGAMELLIERIESGEDIPAKDLGVIMGISVEKHELLSGGATARVERPIDPELAAFYQALTGQGRGMVLEAEELPANGGSSIGPLLASPATPAQVKTGDNLSPANES